MNQKPKKMIEIACIYYFIKKIREITTEKGLAAGKWIAILITSWFSAEILVFVVGFTFFGLGEEDILVLILPALGFAFLAGFLVLNRVKNLKANEDLTLDEFAKEEENFDHFR